MGREVGYEAEQLGCEERRRSHKNVGRGSKSRQERAPLAQAGSLGQRPQLFRHAQVLCSLYWLCAGVFVCVRLIRKYHRLCVSMYVCVFVLVSVYVEVYVEVYVWVYVCVWCVCVFVCVCVRVFVGGWVGGWLSDLVGGWAGG